MSSFMLVIFTMHMDDESIMSNLNLCTSFVLSISMHDVSHNSHNSWELGI